MGLAKVAVLCFVRQFFLHLNFGSSYESWCVKSPPSPSPKPLPVRRKDSTQMKHTTNFNGHSGTMTRVDLKEKRKFSFFATALLKRKKEKPSLNFSSRFLSNASFSTFAVYFLLCVEKITHNKKLAKPPTAKELNPSRKTKTRAKKFYLPAGASLTVMCILTVLFSIDSFAQINTEPVMPTFQQVPVGHSYTPGNPFPDQWDYFPQLKNPLQTMREQQRQQIQQQNRQQMQNFGIEPQPTQEQMKVDYYNQLAIARQRKAQEFYADLNALDNSVRPIDPKLLEELERTKKKLRVADTNSVDFKNHLKYYNSAYNEIVNMLSGKSPLNLKRAVFITENAYHKNKLSYEKYCKQIDDLVFICKQIMTEKRINPKNYMACHFAIQKLFSEKVTYKNRSGKEEIFEPFGYDFIDIFGNTDQTKGFVTKLLNTKTGQCHSLPLLYLILAEELNANAYLAFAPNHSYIKFGNQYHSFGFETTNGTFTSDEWVVASGYVSPTAVKNQIYLVPNTKDKVIAECLVDLEDGVDFLFGKGDFSIKCASTTLKYFPNSIGAILTINNVIVAECSQIAKKYKFPKEEDYYKYPELKKKFDEMIEFELQVEQVGYMKIPNGQYEMWQQTANEEKQRREHLMELSKLQESANEK